MILSNKFCFKKVSIICFLKSSLFQVLFTSSISEKTNIGGY